MKKAIITVFVLLLISLNSFAQTGNIQGYVSDKETGVPVTGVEIRTEEYGKKSVSDASGFFNFENVASGKYRLTYYHEGYKSGVLEVTVTGPMTTKVEIKLIRSEISTGEINVTSTRYQTILKDVPMPMEIVSDYEISKSVYNTIPDALSGKPGLSLIRDGIWATEISIRGLSRANVVTNIDGNRIETATDISARLSLADLNDVDRIEVIKGGVSSLYGTGAFGGVVNIYTKNGDFSNKPVYGGSLISGYNTVNENPNGWMSLFASSQRFYAKVSGSIRDAKNTMTPKGELPNSQFRDNNLNANLGFKPFKNQEFRLSYQRYRGTDIGIPGAGSLFPTNAVVTYPKENRDMVSGEYKIKDIAEPLKEFSVKYYYQSILRDVDNVPNQVSLVKTSSGKLKQKVYVLDITPNARHYTNGLQFKADWEFGRTNYLITGVDFWMRALDSKREKNQRIENYDTTSGAMTSTIYKTVGEKPIPDADYRSIGAYVQDEIRAFDDKLKISVGGRVDQIHVTNSTTYQPVYEIVNGVRNNTPAGQKVMWNSRQADDVSWSTNLGFIYSLTKNYDVTFNVSRSFRSPVLEERYQYIDLGSYLRIGNPDLAPEKGFFTDLGFRVWRDKMTFTGNIFYNHFEDLVTEIPGTYENRPAYIKTNIGKARLYGYDLDIMYNFYRSFVAYGSLSYVRGEDTQNGVNLPQIAPLNAKTGIKFPVYNYINFDINATLYNKQENTAPGEMDTPGYAVFDAGLSSMPVKLKYAVIQLFAGVENIFDKEYRNHLSSNRGLITIEPGRNFYAKLKLDF
ncbi:MAG: TonB-dependent receptor [Bacteroidetes bacterium]|nr:TonB-dependent receptor [Bacteroidota bacterium]